MGVPPASTFTAEAAIRDAPHAIPVSPATRTFVPTVGAVAPLGSRISIAPVAS